MTSPARFTEFIKHDLWSLDLSTLPAFQRVAVQALRLGVAVAYEFRHRLLDARAAGLVYTTLLSLVPFLAVTFSVLKAFGVHQLIEPILAQALEPIGEKSADITAKVIGFVDRLNIGVLGIVGVAGLFYTTYSLIDKIEQALNAIWRVRQGRSWSRKFTDYLSAVLVGPVLVFTAFGVLASLQSNTIVEYVLEIQPFGTLLVWTAELAPFFILCGLFTFFYKLIPYTQVPLGSALVGGVTAAILWGIAGEAFTKFVAESTKYSAIYSSFAVLILFLLWLYVGWMIVLIGAQVSFFHQHPTAYLSRLLWEQGTPAFRERLALRVLSVLARRYLKGARPLNHSELAVELNLPASLVGEQIEQLVERGLIGVLSEPDGLSLLKAPELISAKEILDAVSEGPRVGPLAVSNRNDPISALLSRRNDAVERALAGINLRTLVTEGDNAATKPKPTSLA